MLYIKFNGVLCGLSYFLVALLKNTVNNLLHMKAPCMASGITMGQPSKTAIT
jgi:hypothetical protein